MIICPKCGKDLKVTRKGVTVKLGEHRGMYNADLLGCPGCGNEVLAGFGGEIFPADIVVDYDFSGPQPPLRVI
ncbi:TPA_asm: hypothetical protein vir519_00011 [Caudoviricetes sp. vir519]|nr:TPA_asm: hypothetical protein vir519_00011 [Caudoviricetes sp. vir519]